MIRHIVLTKFLPTTPPGRIAEIYDGLAQLTQRLPGAQGFTGGRSDSPEAMERGYTHGFVIDFDDWDALKSYADNPDHQALGGQLVENAQGGIDGILVMDIEI